MRMVYNCSWAARFSVLIATLAMSLCLVNPAYAVKPDEILSDPAMEARARALSAELRCLVCQNQSIDDSDAPLARDLRLLVRERLKANDTDDQVRDYIVERYGDFVLLKPPMKGTTLLLWLTPLLVLAGAIYLARQAMKGPRTAAASDMPLTAEEQARLDRLLSGRDEQQT